MSEENCSLLYSNTAISKNVTSQKKSKHPISQDRKVVWVVSNRSSIFIAAVKRELKKPRRRRRGQHRLKNEVIFRTNLAAP